MPSLARRGESRIPIRSAWYLIMGMPWEAWIAMSDIKNPAPFYTLKDAAKELNRLLKVDYYDSKKLLSMASVYDLKLYIYSEGWDGRYIYNAKMSQEYNEFVRDENYLAGYSEAQRRKDDTLNIIADNTISCLLHDGCLLQLSLDVINKFRFQKQYEFISTQHNFNEAIYLEDAFNPQTKAYLLEGFKTALQTDHEFFKFLYQSYLDKKTIEAIVDIKIDEIELKKPRCVSIQNAKPKYIGNLVINDELSVLLNDEDSEDVIDEAEEYSKFVINRKDILITHSQLIRILEGTLSVRDTEHHSKQELPEYKIPSKPRGVSVAKKNAKLAAETLADYLWTKDTDKNIKLLEMARIVHSELHKTNHYTQLPSIEAMKDWLRPIAPGHAKLAGRPQQTSD